MVQLYATSWYKVRSKKKKQPTEVIHQEERSEVKKREVPETETREQSKRNINFSQEEGQAAKERIGTVCECNQGSSELLEDVFQAEQLPKKS